MLACPEKHSFKDQLGRADYQVCSAALLILAELTFFRNSLSRVMCQEERCIVLELLFFEVLSRLDDKPEVSCSAPSAFAMWCANRAACIVADPVPI